jgi:Glutamine amidotransferase domain
VELSVAGLLVDALKRLEYRGYDSAGVATLESGRLVRRRAEGKLRNLEARLAREPLAGTTGIGHTRWATHGRPTEGNAHPHATERLAVVHNGIIENFRELREELEKTGAKFGSDTDTEVVAHLVTQEMKNGRSPVDAVAAALPRLRGAFALAFLFAGENDLLIGARKGSPLAIGYGEGEMYLGSDAIALAPFTDAISYLEDGDSAILTRKSVEVHDAKGGKVDGMRLRPLEGLCNRRRHVFHIGRLQSGAATAEHGIDRKPAQEFEDGGEKCVVRSEHHRRTKEDYVGECGRHRQLAFPALADVEGWRGCIGPEARDVGESFDTDPVRLNRHSLRCLDMYGMKSLLSAFDVKADRIDRRVGADQHIGNPPLVSNVGLDRLKTRIIGTEEFATAVRMPRGDPNGKLVLAEMSNDAAAEKAGSSENGDDADTHRENDGKVETPPVATKPSTSRMVTAEFRLESEPADRSCSQSCSP